MLLLTRMKCVVYVVEATEVSINAHHLNQNEGVYRSAQKPYKTKKVGHQHHVPNLSSTYSFFV